MKRYLFLIVLGLGINTISFAQKEEKEGKKDEAPQALKASLLKTFPGSSHIKWEKEGANYEAEFTHSRKKMSAVYDTKGTLLETETGMKPAELPSVILQYVRDNYKGAAIREAAKIASSGGEITYEAEVNKIDLIFDANGKFLKQVKD